MLTPKSTRHRILDAAEHLMRTIGLARTTTKEIARAAGCSEAALYKHFANKEELFVQVLRERLPRLNPLLDELGAEPGERTVEENLTEIVRQAVLFYEQSVPIAASLYAEPSLRRRHNEGLARIGAGPHVPLEALSRYLRTERERGRVRAEADPDAAAALLLGACMQRVFLYDTSTGTGTADDAAPRVRPPQSADDFAACLVRTLLDGIA